MKPLKIFIDTEFTNFHLPTLISLGLATEDGKNCYVEVPFPMNECSDFVRQVVVPMLGRYPGAFFETAELRSHLLIWLESVRSQEQDVEICFDSQIDWDLFIMALEYSIPHWIKAKNVGTETDESLLAQFWQQNQQLCDGEQEHHALSDAKALAYAFRKP